MIQMPHVATRRFLTAVHAILVTLVMGFLVSVGIFALNPCSHRSSSLTLLDQSRAYLIVDASIDADTDAWCEWCN